MEERTERNEVLEHLNDLANENPVTDLSPLADDYAEQNSQSSGLLYVGIAAGVGVTLGAMALVKGVKKVGSGIKSKIDERKAKRNQKDEDFVEEPDEEFDIVMDGEPVEVENSSKKDNKK